MHDQVFFVAQKAFIEKNGEVLILFLPNGLLDFPGGKIQEGEPDLDSALRREVKEETGLDIEIGEPVHRWYFELPPQHPHAGKKVFLVGMSCKYLGGDIKVSPEHKLYKWVNRNNYKEFIDAQGHYKVLEAYFERLG